MAVRATRFWEEPLKLQHLENRSREQNMILIELGSEVADMMTKTHSSEGSPDKEMSQALKTGKYRCTLRRHLRLLILGCTCRMKR